MRLVRTDEQVQAVRGYAPEQAAETAICVSKLVDLFSPAVREAIHPHVERVLESPVTRGDLDHEAFELKHHPPTLKEALLRPIKEARLTALRWWVGEEGRRLHHSRKRRREIHEEMARQHARIIVRDWLEILRAESDDDGGCLMLRRLDDAMLPLRGLHSKRLDYPALPHQAVLMILRKVRRGLPTSRKIPMHAERWLRVDGHQIRD